MIIFVELTLILSGVFTEPSLKQLKSQGFNILYIPFEKIVNIFQKHGVDIYFDETTSEQELSEIVERFKNCAVLDKIREDLILSNTKEIHSFVEALELSIKKQIDYIFVLPLHGREMRFNSLDSAISFIQEYSTIPADAIIDRYVVGIFFNDGSQINCVFKDKLMAIDFLKRNSPFAI